MVDPGDTDGRMSQPREGEGTGSLVDARSNKHYL